MQSDTQIELNSRDTEKNRIYRTKVESFELIKGDIYRIVLKSSIAIDFSVGQYLEILVPGKKYLYFSIANTSKKNNLELHVKLDVDSTSSFLFSYLKCNENVSIAIPDSNVNYDLLVNSYKPLLLIATGTGFTQVKAITEYCLRNRIYREIYIFWGARTKEQFYLSELPEYWSQKYNHLKYFPIILNEQSDYSEICRSINNNVDDISWCQAICCGSPKMVYSVLDDLCLHGFETDNMLSDVFIYSPRLLRNT